MARPSKPYQKTRTNGYTYWVTTIDGQTHHLGADKQRAHAKFHAMMAERGQQTIGKPTGVYGLVNAWLELHPGSDHENRLKPFLGFAGKMPLGTIDADMLGDYNRWLQQQHPRRPSPGCKRGETKPNRRQHLAPRTIRDRLSIARRVLVWASDKKHWIEHAPPLPERHEVKAAVLTDRSYTADELADGFADLPPQAERIARFILSTGCRPKEARLLTWPQVDLEHGVCVLEEHKTAQTTRRTRTIFLNAESLGVLESVPTRKARTGYVFLNRLSNPYSGSGLRSTLKRAGLGRVYGLRHTFAQRVADGDASDTVIPENQLAEMMGHQDTQTTRIYYQLRSATVRQASQAIGPIAPPSLSQSEKQQRKATRKTKRQTHTAASKRKATRKVS